MKPVFAPQDAVVHQLPLLGLSAGDIDVIVCSHLHADHCGCNSFFPGATLVCSEAEMEDALSPDPAALGLLRTEWDHGGPVETFAGSRDLFGDGRITLLPAPGHTRGMIIAHTVTEASGAFVLASDAAPMQSTLDRRIVPRNSWDVESAGRTLDEISRLQADGARVIFGHDETQWRALQAGPESYS
jgi:glyoxylase-like metal-dependent hydrolase (beta-lactamase superfamily II)